MFPGMTNISSRSAGRFSVSIGKGGHTRRQTEKSDSQKWGVSWEVLPFPGRQSLCRKHRLLSSLPHKD